MEIINTTSFLWNTPFRLSVGISNYSGQTTFIEYFAGQKSEDRGEDFNWAVIQGSESTGDFQKIIEAPSKELRVRVDNPSNSTDPLVVNLERKS